MQFTQAIRESERAIKEVESNLYSLELLKKDIEKLIEKNKAEKWRLREHLDILLQQDADPV